MPTVKSERWRKIRTSLHPNVRNLSWLLRGKLKLKHNRNRVQKQMPRQRQPESDSTGFHFFKFLAIKYTLVLVGIWNGRTRSPTPLRMWDTCAVAYLLVVMLKINSCVMIHDSLQVRNGSLKFWMSHRQIVLNLLIHHHVLWCHLITTCQDLNRNNVGWMRACWSIMLMKWAEGCGSKYVSSQPLL